VSVLQALPRLRSSVLVFYDWASGIAAGLSSCCQDNIFFVMMQWFWGCGCGVLVFC